MILERIEFDTSSLQIDTVRDELHARWETEGDPRGPWGYYAISSPTKEEYPACATLEQEIQPLIEGYTFGFIQHYPAGRTDARTGALHLDVHEANAIERPDDISPDLEIERVLLNLHDAPRALWYMSCTRMDLEKKGMAISRTAYTAIEPPEDLRVIQEVKIPPVEEDALWKLTFWGSLIPHVGHTDEGGQLLVCAGAYRRFELDAL